MEGSKAQEKERLGMKRRARCYEQGGDGTGNRKSSPRIGKCPGGYKQ